MCDFISDEIHLKYKIYPEMIPTRNDPHFFRVDLVFISGLYRQSTAFKRIQSWKTIKKIRPMVNWSITQNTSQSARNIRQCKQSRVCGIGLFLFLTWCLMVRLICLCWFLVATDVGFLNALWVCCCHSPSLHHRYQGSWLRSQRSP